MSMMNNATVKYQKTLETNGQTTCCESYDFSGKVTQQITLITTQNKIKHLTRIIIFVTLLNGTKKR